MSSFIFQQGYDFAFDPNGCQECEGNCCIGESGYIWINATEIKALAKHLNLSVAEVQEKHLFKVGYRYSIKEVHLSDENYICCFFDINKKQCGIYDARPSQCKTFPFWEHFKEHKQEVFNECPAVKNI